MCVISAEPALQRRFCSRSHAALLATPALPLPASHALLDPHNHFQALSTITSDMSFATPPHHCRTPATLPPTCCAQEELEQWLAAARQKEDDSLALERYRRQDEARVKELGTALERVSREAFQGERDLEEECVETVAAQAELAKVAQDFRRLHGERQELLAQWEGVLEAITRRDAAILEAGGWVRRLVTCLQSASAAP
jgi:hypothetical protein